MIPLALWRDNNAEPVQIALSCFELAPGNAPSSPWQRIVKRYEDGRNADGHDRMREEWTKSHAFRRSLCTEVNAVVEVDDGKDALPDLHRDSSRIQAHDFC